MGSVRGNSDGVGGGQPGVLAIQMNVPQVGNKIRESARQVADCHLNFGERTTKLADETKDVIGNADQGKVDFDGTVEAAKKCTAGFHINTQVLHIGADNVVKKFQEQYNTRAGADSVWNELGATIKKLCNKTRNSSTAIGRESGW